MKWIPIKDSKHLPEKEILISVIHDDYEYERLPERYVVIGYLKQGKCKSDIELWIRAFDFRPDIHKKADSHLIPIAWKQIPRPYKGEEL